MTRKLRSTIRAKGPALTAVAALLALWSIVSAVGLVPRYMLPSPLDVVKAFEEANGVKIPYEIKPRRAGDIAVCYSDPKKAEAELGWKAKYNLIDMCRDSWNWQKKNPKGFEE